MPNFPIIDTHVHLWDPQQMRIAWLDDDALLAKPFGLAEYAAHTHGHVIEALVYVEVDVAPAYSLLEAQAAVALAAHEPRLRGVVAAAPLEFGEQARAYLAALVALGPLVKGVRRILQGERDPAYCLRPGFVRGVQMLAALGLSFDICINYRQLAAAVELVRRCPDTSFILDHIAKPGIQAGIVEPWKTQIAELAALPNVVCKVSGVVTEADHAAWTLDAIAPYVAHVLAAFGEERVLFGGDWPVVLHAASYARWVAALATLTEHLSETAKRKLWAENARRVYRL